MSDITFTIPTWLPKHFHFFQNIFFLKYNNSSKTYSADSIEWNYQFIGGKIKSPERTTTTRLSIYRSAETSVTHSAVVLAVYGDGDDLGSYYEERIMLALF